MNAPIDITAISGVSCLLFAEGRLVFEIQKPHKWVEEPGQPPGIGVGGIGGTVEAGETPLECLQREAIEEIQCPLDLWSARLTANIDPSGIQLLADFSLDGLRPALVWEISHPQYKPGFKVAVFLGRALGDPQPDDLPAIILAPPDFIDVLADRPSVRAAREAGAEFRTNTEIPSDGRLVVANTLRCLLALRRVHPELYDEFLRPPGNT